MGCYLLDLTAVIKGDYCLTS